MKLPLDGVRILDLSRMLAGDYGAQILGDMGAEVIKIEDPEGGDPLRQMAPHFVAGESAYFLSINRNKKSLTLDLTKPRGSEIFHELVRKSDVVFDNFRPGILEKLGADYETVKKINPRIISCSISSYGATGPYKDQPGFDLVLQALSGAMSITGEPGGSPVRMGIPMGDLGGSMFAAFSISAALYAREKTGEGRKIDLSLLDCLTALLTYVAQYYFTNGEVPQLIGSGHMSVVPYRVYRTKDGHITIAVFVEKFWEKLCEVLDVPKYANDKRFKTNALRIENRHAVDAILEERFARGTNDEWMKKLHAVGVPAAPVNTVDKVFRNEQILARNMLIEIDHPKCGKIKNVGNPVKMPQVGEVKPLPSPLLGEHTKEILKSLLGMSDQQVTALRAEKVI